MKKQIVYVVGDIHGRWNVFNSFINKLQQKHKEDNLLIISCGDFGYWPNVPAHNGFVVMEKGLKINTEQTKILFCDGNHEDHHALEQLMHNEVMPGVFYMPRGSVYTLQDGRVVLFMGGAYSIDRDVREENSPLFGWFAQETISYADMMKLPANIENIDILISHTCSNSVVKHCLRSAHTYCNDSSQEYIDQILYMSKPSLWYFGHWHTSKTGMLKNTRWECLDMLAAGRTWWRKLTDKR